MADEQEGDTYPWPQTSSNLLSIVLDCNQDVWANNFEGKGDKIGFTYVLESILVYINAFLMLNNTNHVSIFACNKNASHLLAPSDQSQAQDFSTIKKDMIENLKNMTNEDSNRLD